jgi:hypothetical protein
MFDTTHDEGEQLFTTATAQDEAAASEEVNPKVEQPQTQKQSSAMIKQKKVEVLTKKVLSGEADLSSVPESDKWMIPLVEAEVNRVEKLTDIDSIVEQKLQERAREQAERQAAERFETIKTELNQMDLDESERQLIQKKYENLVRKGMGKTAALEEAKDYFETVVQASEEGKRVALKRMSITPGTKKTDDKPVDFVGENFHKRGDSRDRVAVYEAIIKNKKTLVED